MFFLCFLGNIHKLGRLLTHEWWTVNDKEGKSKERYLFLFKARILICKVRRISDERSVFILKEIVRLPEIEIKDLDDSKFEIQSKTDGTITLTAHKEETKAFWLKEIQQYITDVVALQEHSIDDLRIDPKQHFDSNEPTIKLPHRIEAYESSKSVKPSDVAEDYTISVYSTTKAVEEIKVKGQVSSLKESTSSEVHHSESHTSTKTESQKATVPKDTSKIPVLKKSSEKQAEDSKPTPKVEETKTTSKVEESVKVQEPKSSSKVEEKKPEPKVEEKKPETKVKEEQATIKVEEKEKEVKQIVKQENKTVEKPKAEEKPKALEEIKPKEETKTKESEVITKTVTSELSEVEASVSDKLDKLSRKLKAIRQTETNKEVTKIITKEEKTIEPTVVEVLKKEEIREEIQEKIDDYICESSVIRRIEERYKRNYKDKDINTVIKASVDREFEESSTEQQSRKSSVSKVEESKSRKSSLAKLKVKGDTELQEKQPQITTAADNNKSSDNQPSQQEQTQGNSSDQSTSNQGTTEQSSRGNQQSSNSGDSRKPDRSRESSPSSPGSIRLPGFFDPPPPTQYETSIEVYVKKERPPVPPPIITRKVVVKNEELERKTQDFLNGDLPYEKEDFSLASAQRKVKNLKHNLGKTGETIKFAEDTYSKAFLGDFQNIKTPGTVVPVTKKEPSFEYQYTVEDPVTGVCITTSQPIDFEDAEDDLTKLSKMEADHNTKVTKRVEGTFLNIIYIFLLLSTNIIDNLMFANRIIYIELLLYPQMYCIR